MPNLTVRGIPKRVHSILKRDAKQHGRSLNAEILTMLDDKAEMARRRASAAVAMKRIDKLRDEIAKTYPAGLDSTELIREDRDSR